MCIYFPAAALSVNIFSCCGSIRAKVCIHTRIKASQQERVAEVKMLAFLPETCCRQRKDVFVNKVDLK